MPAKPQILFVLSSCSKFATTGTPTGWYLSEFAHPYNVLKDEFDITVASPSGGPAPLDPSSITAAKDDRISTDFLEKHSSLWTQTNALSTFLGKAADFSAVFFVGGHGPMFDLSRDPECARLVLDFAKHARVVSAVCHGPAALLHPDLKSFLDGANVTGFSNSEENAVGLSDAVPFSLEDRLKEHGAKYSKGDDWKEHVVVAKGGLLITGQNPASAGGVARKVRDAVFGELTDNPVPGAGNW